MVPYILRTVLLAISLSANLVPSVSAWSINNNIDRSRCQERTVEPLEGCAKNYTILVDSTGSYGAFKTVQSAVSSLPNNTKPYVILIAPGNYTEQVNVTRRGPTYLLGQTSHPTQHTHNTVNIIWAAVAGTADNAYTSTLTVAPNLNASLTGSGPTGFAVPDNTPFGCEDFRTYNINFINNYAPYSDGPSLALSISRANGGFYYSGFYSYQDTIYVGKLGNAYMKGGEVAGQTDFFYGFGTCYVTNTEVSLRGCGGGITAWKGTNTTFENKYGVYITYSTVQKANSSLSIEGKCALGRPWNDDMRSIFANNYLDDSILPAGFIDWAGTPRYDNHTTQSEYESFGPGWNASARAANPFETVLTTQEYMPYSSPAKVFQKPDGMFGYIDWIDFSA